MIEFRRRKARERLAEGQAALARADFEAAREALDHALRLDPDPLEGWLALAESLARQGKRIEAARVLERAREDHRDPALELAAAQAHAEIGCFELAERILVDLQRRWPSEREPLVHLARVLRDTRAWTRLVELLETSLAGAHAGDAELGGLLDRVRVWQGRGGREARPRPPSLREQLLERGTLLLGTGFDDGDHVPWYSTYLASERDVAVTCARLLALVEHFGLRWSAVAAVDPAARVLALVLAGALELPCLAPDDPVEAREADVARDVLAIASVLAPDTRLPTWALACGEAGSLFAFAVTQHHEHASLPALVGVAGGDRICVAWHRLGEARIGFSRFGLIAPLPDELDERAPETIAAALLPRVLELRDELGPGFVHALRQAIEQRQRLHAGLRARSEVARIPAPARDASEPDELLAALEHASVTRLERALAAHEHALDRIGPRELAALEARFRTTPSLRAQLADLIYRVSPPRLVALFEAMLDGELPPHEREPLLHLAGCSPWGGPGPLAQALARGGPAIRCELVQSKYALHRLAEAEGDAFGRTLDVLLGDAPQVVIATLRWLHDNPQVHVGQLERVAPLTEHPHPDVVFETLQLLRIAGRTIPAARHEALLRRDVHPRLRSAAIELVECWPLGEALERLDAILSEDALDVAWVWAATRSLLRVGETPDAWRSGAALAAGQLAQRVERGADEADIRAMLQALASAEHFEQLEPLFGSSDALTKIAASALARSLLALDDPRFVALLRTHALEFGLDPPRGLARFLLAHGLPALDHALVRAAEGATDPWAGYEAKAVLARWDEHEATAELARAIDYVSPLGHAALAAWIGVLERDEPERLVALREGDARERELCFAIVRDRALRGSPAARERLVAQLAGEGRWRHFLEIELRAQVPGPYVVGGQVVEFEIMARALPGELDSLIERTLSGTPDRFALDLLEWLARTRGELGRTWAQRHVDSGHFGMRSAARRIVAGV